MNIQVAKEIPIELILHKYNYLPKKQYSNKMWFATSIGRVERESQASLLVDTVKNRFVDYGLGENGDSIDLIKLIHRVETKEAISILAELFPSLNFSSFKGSVNKVADNSMKITEISDVRHIALISYLEQRGVSYYLGKKYCKQIHYTNKGRKYYSLGFKNEKNGWELRSVGFKGCIGSKSITVMKGSDSAVNIFEGFFNFLSALMHFRTDHFTNTTIILNSTINFRLIKDELIKYEQINMFIDNDSSGNAVKEKILLINPNAIDWSNQIHPEFNDFNDFILNKAMRSL